MRNPQGYAQLVGDMSAAGIYDFSTDTRIVASEMDTFSCGHCGRIVHVPVRTDPASIGGGCRICQSNICPKCVDNGTCTPQEEMLAQMEKKAEVNRWF